MATVKNKTTKQGQNYQITGRVIDAQTGAGVAGLSVEAWDKDLIIEDLVGSAITDKSGKFIIKFNKSYYQEIVFNRKPDIYFKIFKDKMLLLSTEKDVLWNVSVPDLEIKIEVSIEDNGDQNTFQDRVTIKGTVSTDAKRLPTGMTVQIINKLVLDELVLGSAAPDNNGRYKIVVPLKSKENPALLARAIDLNKNILASSITIFNLSDPVTLDIFIPTNNIKRKPEYTEIEQSIKQFIGNKPITEVSPEQLDLIAGKTEFSVPDLELYQKAQAISLSENIPVEILYGLFKKGLPPKLSSLYEMNSLDLSALIAEAVKQNIIAPQNENNVAQAIEKIQQYALKNVLNEPLLTNGPAFKDLLQTSGVSENVIGNFVKAAEKHSGQANQFWQELEKGNHEISLEETAKLKFCVQAGSISLGHLPMTNCVMELKNDGKINDIKDLVSWNRDQWIKYLTEAENKVENLIPERVPGNNHEEKRSAYALAISRILEQAYPTQSIASKIEADDENSFKSFSTFIGNNALFEIGETNIAEYLKENKDALTGIENPEQFTKDLKKLQLQYMLSPGFDRYESIKTLQKMDVGSSTDVLNRSWNIFSKDYTQNGGSIDMAGVVYEMATNNVATIQNVYFTYGPSVELEPYVTRIPNYIQYRNNVTNSTDPDLTTLFGSQDFCKCRHSRSIYGPAAYMVDIFQFLRRSHDYSSEPRLRTSGSGNALQVLLDRRPDLCHIDLNSENTETPLPYIDLINEMFENAVYKERTGNAPDYSQCQTRGNSEELLAHPEHILKEVYENTLSTAIYPWTLPFDFFTEEGRSYLAHLKLPRYKVMDTMFPGPENAYLDNEAAVDEILKLCFIDREIITGASSATYKTQWGLGEEIDLVNRLKTPDALLKYSGMDYSDLKVLLKTWFINPNANIEIVYDEESQCDLCKAAITNITENVLMKILRFIRLKNKLGWSIRELDMALKTLHATNFNNYTLLYLSHIVRLVDYMKLPLYQILAFWGDIYTGHKNDDANTRSPYELLFLNKSVINPVDAAFELNNNRDELKVTTNSIDAEEHTATIKAGLGISGNDLDILINNVLPDKSLNLANLSNLYRHVILARSLNLKINELVLLKSLSNTDPFKSFIPVKPVDFAKTIIFLKDYQKIKKANFKVTELAYLLNRDYDIAYGVGLSEDEILVALTDIRLGLRKIADENQFAPDPQGSVTTAKLASLLSVEDLNTTITILEPGCKLIESEQIEFIKEKLGFFLKNTGDAVAKLVGDQALTVLQERYEYVLNDLLEYLKNTSMREYLRQRIASAMELDAEVAGALLFSRIKGPDDPTIFAGDTLKDISFISLENETIEKKDVSAQFNTYILLHKTALILRKFRVTSTEIDYLFAGAFDPKPANWPGWFNFNQLPVVAESTPRSLYAQLFRLSDLFSFYNSIPSSDKNLFSIMKDVFDPDSLTTIDQLLETISGMTKWDLGDIKELSNVIFHFSTISYANEIPFIRLGECMDILKLTGAKAVDVRYWISATLPSSVSEKIVHAVKSLYGEKEWLAIARSLRNQIRERQRSSLTDWLVNNNSSGINNKFELYNYYLVDPEMSSCMLTSRIRLALSSVQLFVQRCLMNLEPGVEIKNEDLEHWDQWKWMKTYRLWEANRKIFCYPENWIEPELRDDKSNFFRELEQELEQGEVSEENIEKAYLNYLTKLEAVSHMEIMGICDSGYDYYTWDRPLKYPHYIFGRTVGTPNILYFRKYNRNTWTPWERIDIDFEGDHLVPVVYNNKLYLFWPVFTTKTEKSVVEADEPFKYREIRIAWSVYYNGKWSAKYLTDKKIDERKNYNYLRGKWYNVKEQYEDGTKRYFVGKVIDSYNNLAIAVYERYFNGDPFLDAAQYLKIGSFSFNPAMIVTTTVVDTSNPSNEDEPFVFYGINKIYNAGKIYQKVVETDKMSHDSKNALRLRTGYYHNNEWHEYDVCFLEKTPSDFFSFIFFDDYVQYNNCHPFIYQDTDHTFFIDNWCGYRIYNHYHPYVTDFLNAVCSKGIEGLLDPEYDASNPNALSNKLRRQQVKRDFFTQIYGTRTTSIQGDLPIEEIDFSLRGAYSVYNWELFFHIPMLIANKLSMNQKFEEAQKWYHYIFDPTDTTSDYNVPQRFWKIKPFVKIYDETEDNTPMSIQQLMKLINEGDEDAEAQIEAWRKDPFKPHLVARMRITAYQKNVVMKYIDNLLSWADMLFRQDTMETTNEATQLYMLAWYILGEEPRMLEGKEPEARNYCELEEEGIDDFSNAMVALETMLVKYFGNKYQAGFKKFENFMLAPQKNYEDITLYSDDKLWFTKPNESTFGFEMTNLQKGESIEKSLIANPGSKDVVLQSSNVNFSTNNEMRWGFSNFGIGDLAPNSYWIEDVLVTHPEWGLSFVTEIVKSLYFCIPHNDNLLGYWDTVKDRMFKLRNCMNIEGIVRQLPLYEPPIDPGMLVRAVAAGMDLSSALNDLDASLPNYRFNFMIEKAKEFAGVVRNAGSLLLGSLEKKDAESLALLRANNEISLMEAMRQLKKYQLEEVLQNINALEKSISMADDKYLFYKSRSRWNTAEGFQVGLMAGGIALQIAAQIINLASGVAYAVPEFFAGGAGMMGSPVAVVGFGGQEVGNAAQSAARAINELAGTLYQGASLSGIIAGIQRRTEDWDFMSQQSKNETDMIKYQKGAAEKRYNMAQLEIDNHEKQIDQRKAEYEYMKSRFTNKELYNWMTGQVASIYFQAYQMAYDLAKRVERSYKYEIPDSNDTFISYGYWDSLKKGLLAGEKLQNDLMRMEAAYLEKNKRTYEITKHVSLGVLDSFALMQLRENGKCFFSLPEEIFDMDYAGHYMRRIKSISITIPCVTGPYTGVNAKLTLQNNSIRKTTAIGNGDDPYVKRTDGSEDRFIENLAMIQSIATSNAQNDRGLFELNFNDARYLPFEGAGVISSWQLELPKVLRSFDYNTISDVIITLNYTSKDGGDVFKEEAENHLKLFIQNSEEMPLERLFSIKHGFGNEWYRFLNPPEEDADQSEEGPSQQLDIILSKKHFPFMFHKDTISVTSIDVILQLKNPDHEKSVEFKFVLSSPASSKLKEGVPLSLISSSDSSNPNYLNCQPVILGFNVEFSVEEPTLTFKILGNDIPEAYRVIINGCNRLNKEQIENMYLITHYYTALQ